MEEINNTLRNLTKQIAEQIIKGNIEEIQKDADLIGWYDVTIRVNNKNTCIISVKKDEKDYDILICSHNDLLSSDILGELKQKIYDAVINKYNIINNNLSNTNNND